MLQVKNLSYQYKNTNQTVLQNISFEFNDGALALIGPNGAGKSTLIGLLSGLLQPSKGEVLYSTALSTNSIAVVPQGLAFYENLTVRANLNFFASIVSKSATGESAESMVDRVIQQCKLTNIQTKTARVLSGGQKRKLNLAIGLLSRAPMIFLDEPTVGIDIESRMDILNLLKDHVQQGNAIIYTSHLLNEVEYLCDSVSFLQDGKLLMEPTPLNSLSEKNNLLISCNNVDTIAAQLKVTNKTVTLEKDVIIFKKIHLHDIPDIIKLLQPFENDIISLNYGNQSLDNHYFSLVKPGPIIPGNTTAS